MRKHLLSLALALLVPSSTYAGDLMNVEFLKAQAKKSNLEMKSLNEQLNQYIYNQRPSGKQFALNTVANGIFTGTYYVTNILALRIAGTGAGGMFYAPYAVNYFKAKKSNKEIQKALQRLSALNAQIDSQVESLYLVWKKEGSEQAKGEILRMTSPAVISEIESNIQQELAFKSSKKESVPLAAAK